MISEAVMDLRVVARCMKQVWFRPRWCSLLWARAHSTLMGAHGVQLTPPQAFGNPSRARGSTNARAGRRLCASTPDTCVSSPWLEGQWETVIVQEKWASCITAAPTNPIISVVTQPVLLGRNICNRKWADHSLVSDGEGFRSLCDFFKLTTTRGKIPLL